MRNDDVPAVNDDSTDESTSTDDVKMPGTDKAMTAAADNAIGGSGPNDENNTK